jgi:hypothetical protein
MDAKIRITFLPKGVNRKKLPILDGYFPNFKFSEDESWHGGRFRLEQVMEPNGTHELRVTFFDSSFPRSKISAGATFVIGEGPDFLMATGVILEFSE